MRLARHLRGADLRRHAAGAAARARAARHRAHRVGNLMDHRDALRIRAGLGIFVVHAVDVRQNHERIRADHIWLSNPVLVRGLGMAPVIGAALDGRRALMLCIASLILVTFTRVLAVAICHLTKNRFRPVVYCYSAALLYIPTYVLLYALFGSDLTLLGIYLPIMVVEPAIVKRMEFSDLEPVRDAFRHGFNNALGMCVVLLIVGCLRELLATGAVFGNVILHNALLPLAALPAGGFVIVGILAAIWCAAANLYTDYKHEEVRRLYADRKH